MDLKTVKEAHRFCTNNQEQLAKSKLAGCFYCLQIFPASEVKDFLAVERTALCPKCQIDSVIGDFSGFELTKNNLKEMYGYWFGIKNKTPLLKRMLDFIKDVKYKLTTRTVGKISLALQDVGVQLEDKNGQTLNHFKNLNIAIIVQAIWHLKNRKKFPWIVRIEPYKETLFDKKQSELLILDLRGFKNVVEYMNFEEAIKGQIKLTIDILIRVLQKVEPDQSIRFIGD